MAALATSSMESESLAIVPVGSACGGTPVPSPTSPKSSIFARAATDAVSATFEQEMENAVHAMGVVRDAAKFKVAIIRAFPS